MEPVVGLPLMRDGDLGEASMLVPASQNLQAEAPVEIDVAAPNVLERGRGEAPGLAGERPGLDAEVGATVMEAVAAAPLPEARIPHLDEAVWEIGENGVGNREGVLIGVFDEGWDPCIVDRVKGLAYVVSKKRLCAAATVLENGYGFLHTRDQLLASSTECNQNCHEAHGMQMLRIVHANAGGTPIFYWNHAGMADPTAYESTLLYAAKIIIRTAGRRRCVINLSLDMDTSGGHDEWEPLAADIDGFNESTGAVFVVAAGNSHVREGYHARFSATNVAGARELSFDLRGVSCSEGFTSVKCDEVKERAKSGSVKGPGCRDHRVELWFDSHAGSHLAIKVRELVDGKWEDTETVRFQPQENVQYLPGKAGTVTYRQQFREDEPEDGFSLLLNLPEARQGHSRGSFWPVKCCSESIWHVRVCAELHRMLAKSVPFPRA